MMIMLFEFLPLNDYLGLPLIIFGFSIAIMSFVLMRLTLSKEKSYEDIQRERDEILGIDHLDGSKTSRKKPLPSVRNIKKPDSSGHPLNPISIEPLQNESTSVPNDLPPLLLLEDITTSDVERSLDNSTLKKREKSNAPVESYQHSLIDQVEDSSGLQTQEFIKTKKFKKNKNKEIASDTENVDFSQLNGNTSTEQDASEFKLTQLTQENKEFQRQLQIVQRNLTQKTTELAQASSSLNQQNIELNKLNQKITKQQAEAKVHTDKAQEQNNQLSRVKSELDRRQNAITAITLQNAEIRRQNDSKVQSLQVIIDKKDAVQPQLTRSLEKVQQELQLRNSEFTSLEGEINSLRVYPNKVRELEQELQHKDDQICTDGNSINDLKQQLANQMETLSQQTLQLQNQEHQILLQQNLSQSSVQSVEQLQESLTEKDLQLIEFKGKAEAMEKQMSELEETAQSLSSEFISIKSQSRPTSPDIDELQRSINEKDSLLMAKDEELSKLSDLVNDSQAKLDNLDSIMEEFEILKQQFNPSLHTAPVSIEIIAQNASKQAILEATIKRLEDICTEKDTTCNETCNIVQNLEGKLIDASKELHEKSEEKDEIAREKKVTQEKLDSFKSKNNELRNKNWKLQDEVNAKIETADKQVNEIQKNVQKFVRKLFPDIKSHRAEFSEWLAVMQESALSYVTLLKKQQDQSSGENGSNMEESYLHNEKEIEYIEEIQHLRDALVDTEDRISQLQSDVLKEISSLKDSGNDDKIKAEEFQLLLIEKEDELSRSLDEYEVINLKMTELKTDILPELKEKFQEKEEENKSLTYNLDRITKKSEDLYEQLTNSIRYMSEKADHMQNLKSENESLISMSEELQSYKQDLAASRQEMESLNSDQNESNKKLQEQATKIQEIENDKETLTKEMDLLNSKLTQLREENKLLVVTASESKSSSVSDTSTHKSKIKKQTSIATEI